MESYEYPIIAIAVFVLIAILIESVKPLVYPPPIGNKKPN